VALGFLRTRRRRDRRGGKPPESGGHHFWGVKLAVSESGVCCEAMRAIEGQCCAIDRAPPLPLSDCDLKICQCRYDYLPERRANRERRSGEDRRGAIRFDAPGSDRRSGEDRRASSDPWKWAHS
jgi:hypothetical protein